MQFTVINASTMNSVIVSACRSFFSEIIRESVDFVIYYRKIIAISICFISALFFILGLMLYGVSKEYEEGILGGIIMISVGVIGMVSPCCCFLGSYFMTHSDALRKNGDNRVPSTNIMLLKYNHNNKI